LHGKAQHALQAAQNKVVTNKTTVGMPECISFYIFVICVFFLRDGNLVLTYV